MSRVSKVVAPLSVPLTSIVTLEVNVGEILDPAIAALAFTFAFVIAPSRTTFTSAAPLAS